MCPKISSDPTSRPQVLTKYHELFDEYLRMSVVSFSRVTSYGFLEQEINHFGMSMHIHHPQVVRVLSIVRSLNPYGTTLKLAFLIVPLLV